MNLYDYRIGSCSTKDASAPHPRPATESLGEAWRHFFMVTVRGWRCYCHLRVEGTEAAKILLDTGQPSQQRTTQHKMLVMQRFRKADIQFHIEKTLLMVKRHLKAGRNEGEEGERETKRQRVEEKEGERKRGNVERRRKGEREPGG